MRKTSDPLKRFVFVFLDAGNCDIEGCGTEVMARDLCHALQKIAPLNPDDAVAVRVLEMTS